MIENYVITEKKKSKDILLTEKKVLFLGEAGCGKAYECESLVKKLCERPVNNIIPVYLPLIEYGKLYQSIEAGINYKLRSIKNISKDMISDMLKNGNFVLLLDGIDDITNTSMYEKFISEVKDMFIYESNNYYFITGRRNRYHDEIKDLKVYELNEISNFEIEKKLEDEKVYTKLPSQYIELFKNPLLLSIGIKVLKCYPNNEFINKSQLFDTLIRSYCDKWDKTKGINKDKIINYRKLFLDIGKLSYEKFNEPFFDYEYFEKYFANNADHKLIDIFSLNFFEYSEHITFFHKLYKEYFTAYYIINTYKFSESIDFYLSLINIEEYKEVFIFIAGMIDDMSEQDLYLDFVLNNNLPLYIECVKSKCDIYKKQNKMSSSEYTKRYCKRQIIQIHYLVIGKWGDL